MGAMHRRVTALAVTLLLLGASCAGPPADDNASTAVGDGVRTGGTGSAGTSAPDGGDDAGAAGAADETAGAATGPGTPSPTAGAAAPPSTAAADRSWLGGPGSYARRLLQATPAAAVTLEILRVGGAEPLPGTLDHVRRRMADVTGKPIDVPVVDVAGQPRNWTAAELVALADRESRAAHTNERAVVRMLFVHGTFDGSDQVLGVAVRGDVMAVFTDRVAASSTVLVPRSTLEKAVGLHELGHILGLVGLVVNADRQDADHPGHSSNRHSVMFWAVESSLVGQVLGGSPPTEFDNDDLADLAAIRAGR